MNFPLVSAVLFETRRATSSYTTWAGVEIGGKLLDGRSHSAGLVAWLWVVDGEFKSVFNVTHLQHM